MKDNNKVIGIDLGTGFSCVAVMEGGKPSVIVNGEGQRTTPSVIYIDQESREVGASAKRKMTMKPKNTVSFVKRFMGANWDDKDVQEMLKRVSYDVVNEGGKPRIKIDGKLYSPEEISSYTLAKLKKVAEDYYGTEVTKAVITVPAWFNDAQRQICHYTRGYKYTAGKSACSPCFSRSRATKRSGCKSSRSILSRSCCIIGDARSANFENRNSYFSNA